VQNTREPTGAAQPTPQRYSHACQGAATALLLVQSSNTCIKETVTGTLVLPVEKEPQIHQLHTALSICIPEAQQICCTPCTASVEDSAFETDFINTAFSCYIF